MIDDVWKVLNDIERAAGVQRDTLPGFWIRVSAGMEKTDAVDWTVREAKTGVKKN